MLRLASDADVHGEIIRGLRRRQPALDVVRVQDVLPENTADAEVLACAAVENRVLITNDRNTMIGTAHRRVIANELVSGLIATTIRQSLGSTIDDILLIAECMMEHELQDRVVVYLPLRD
jgi:predicted nuclease of predicted toxin-antitoxin system